MYIFQEPFSIVAERCFHGSRASKTELTMDKAIVARGIEQRRSKQNFIQYGTNAPLIHDTAEVMISHCNFWGSIW